MAVDRPRDPRGLRAPGEARAADDPDAERGEPPAHLAPELRHEPPVADDPGALRATAGGERRDALSGEEVCRHHAYEGSRPRRQVARRLAVDPAEIPAREAAVLARRRDLGDPSGVQVRQRPARGVGVILADVTDDVGGEARADRSGGGAPRGPIRSRRHLHEGLEAHRPSVHRSAGIGERKLRPAQLILACRCTQRRAEEDRQRRRCDLARRVVSRAPDQAVDIAEGAQVVGQIEVCDRGATVADDAERRHRAEVDGVLLTEGDVRELGPVRRPHRRLRPVRERPHHAARQVEDLQVPGVALVAADERKSLPVRRPPGGLVALPARWRGDRSQPGAVAVDAPDGGPVVARPQPARERELPSG